MNLIIPLFLTALAFTTSILPNDECGMCEFGVRQVETLINSNFTINEIEKLCNVFPEKLDNICDEGMQIYLPEIIEKLENKYSPSEICQKLKLCSNKVHSKNIIDYINNDPTSTWIAGESEKFKNKNIDDINGLFGTKMNFRPSYFTFPTIGLPTSFDAREKWNKCIHPIRDQEQCGSCWAFGATEALSDRFCISSQGKINVVLSPQSLVSCDKTNDGCGGGYLDKAWEYMQENGVTTDACIPYQAKNTICPEKCQDGSDAKMYYVDNGSIVTFSDIGSIQQAIMTNGSVEGAFSVYEDFMSYKSGVYQHKTGRLLGGHAIKILGWGVESGNEYWLCANSWGTGWGDEGYFKILRGVNECGIESNVIAGMPKLSYL
jgi:cathepsin B